MALPITRILNCPSPEALRQLASGSLDEDHAGQIFRHIDGCETCQRKMDRLAGEADDLVAAARRSAEDIDRPRLEDLIQKAQKIGDNASEAGPAARQVREAVTVEGFVSGLRRCGLFPEDEVEALLSDIDASESSSSIAKELVGRQKLTPFQARVLLKGRWKGLVLGNYIILDKLGQGGMGSVFKARHRRLGRIVCVKVVNSAGRKSPKMLERFRNEARTVAALSHPNFVVAHDADEAESVPFLVMEYVEGKDLAKQVSTSGPLTVDFALKLIHQAATALQYAHDQGVTHRDIKPHNLLVADDPESGDVVIKILDLGLARFDSLLGANTDASTHAAMTNTGVIMGTVDYMSPEQALRSRDADNRSDIYSLGCTLHYLATGRPVFDGDTLMARLIAHREAEIPSLERSCPGAPPGLDAVFNRMLAKSPDQRYQSMDAVAADLDAILNGQTPLAAAGEQTPQPESVLEKQRRRRRKPAYRAWVTVCTLIFLVAGSVWAVMLGPNPLADPESPNRTDTASNEPVKPVAVAADSVVDVGELLTQLPVKSFFDERNPDTQTSTRAVAILPKKFDAEQFAALQAACERQGVQLAIAAPQPESVTSIQDPEYTLSPDVVLDTLKPDDYDMAFLVGGSVQDFQPLYENGMLATFLNTSGGMGRVVAATSEQARGVFDQVEFYSSSEHREYRGVVHSRVYGTNGAIAYARDGSAINELVNRSVRIRETTISSFRTNHIATDTLAGFGNGRALIVLSTKGFDAGTFRNLQWLLREQGVQTVIASSEFTEAVGDDNQTKVPVGQSLREFPNLQKVRFSNLFDYVFIVGGNTEELSKRSGRDLKDILEHAVLSGCVVSGLSADSRKILDLSPAIRKTKLETTGCCDFGTLENAGAVAMADDIQIDQLPMLFRRVVALRQEALQRTDSDKL